MSNPVIVLCPKYGDSIETFDELEIFFYTYFTTVYTVKDKETKLFNHYSPSIRDLYCYVSLEFVTYCYIHHKKSKHSWEYTFNPVINVPGIYKVTASPRDVMNAPGGHGGSGKAHYEGDAFPVGKY